MKEFLFALVRTFAANSERLRVNKLFIFRLLPEKKSKTNEL